MSPVLANQHHGSCRQSRRPTFQFPTPQASLQPLLSLWICWLESSFFPFSPWSTSQAGLNGRGTKYKERSDSLQSAYQGVLATSVTHSGDRAKSEAQNQATARSGSEGRERVLVDGIVKPFQTGPPFPKQVGLGMGRSRAVSIFVSYPLYQEHHFFPCAAGRTPLWRMSPPCKEPGTGQHL